MPLDSGFYCNAIPYALRASVDMECAATNGPGPNQTSCSAHVPPWGECRFMVQPDAEEISPAIILAFGVLGFIFDLLLLSKFQKWHAVQTAQAEAVPTPSAVAEARPRPNEGSARALDTGRVNMCSALAHVLADSLRSLTTIVESVLIMTFGMDAARTDSWATLFISLSIIFGTSSALVQWTLGCWRYLCQPRSQDTVAIAS